MIGARLFLTGLLTSAVGWQIVFGETMVGATATGLTCVLVGAVLGGLAIRDIGIWQRIALILGVVVLQFVAAHGFADLLARQKEVPGLAAVLAALVDLAGLEAAALDGRVLFHAGNVLVDYRPSLVRLGAFPLTIALAGAMATAALIPLRRPWLILVGLAGVMLGYALLRVWVILLARPLLPDQGLDISPWFILITLLPMVLLIPRRVALVSVGEDGERWWARHLAAAAAGISLALWLGWADPGREKPGRIVFDDSHGMWEPTDVPFNTERFGRRYSYTYTNFFDLLTWHYEVERHSEGPITEATLADTDVLIVKTPVRPFLAEEIEAIDGFVRAGGGLFLIGDHTNLFGMTTFINALAQRFALSFRSDDTFDLISEGATYWEPGLWLPHPIAALVPSFEFETSASIVAPLSARGVIVGYGMGAEPADYNNPGFFGNIHLDQREDFGFFLQHVALDHGRGRVAAFSDSTTFSNFSIFFPGRRELALGTIAWLNREATVLRHVPTVAIVVVVFCLVQLVSEHRRRDAPVVAGALVLGLALGSAIVLTATRGLALPPLQQEVRTVVFDRELSNAAFPSSLSTDREYELVGYDTFVVAAQRLGYMPIISDDFESSLQDADLVVLFHPQRDLSDSESAALLRFIAGGGAMLLVDGLAHEAAGTAAILEPFGLSVGQTALQLPAERVTPIENGDALALYRPLQYVVGGFPVLTDGDGYALYSEVELGEGRIGVLAEGATVSRAALGNRFYDNPTDQQRQAFDTTFLILRRMMGEEADP